MKVTKQLLIICFAMLGSLVINAQDIHFSQFYLSPLNLNPALTGVMNCNIRLVANYRNQWASVLKSNAYNTYSASYDQKIPVGRYDYFGVGATFWGDKAGQSSFATLTGKLALSYSKRMGGYRAKSNYLVVGVEAGLSQRSIDFLNLTWGTQILAGISSENYNFQEFPSGEEFDRDNFLFADLSAGLLWFSVFDEDNNLYFGAAYNHLNRANVSFIPLDTINGAPIETDESLYSKFTFHAGGEFMMSDRFGLVPGLVTLIQGPSFELNGGTSLKWLMGSNRRTYQAFQVGMWMRLSNHYEKALTTDALILSTRFDYDQFSIGFSYDINISSLRPASNSSGAFEFALVYKICGPEKRNVYCPNF